MESKKTFVQQPEYTWFMLILFAPLGIYLLFKNKHYSKSANITLTALFGMLFLLLALSLYVLEPVNPETAGNSDANENEEAESEQEIEEENEPPDTEVITQSNENDQNQFEEPLENEELGLLGLQNDTIDIIDGLVLLISRNEKEDQFSSSYYDDISEILDNIKASAQSINQNTDFLNPGDQKENVEDSADIIEYATDWYFNAALEEDEEEIENMMEYFDAGIFLLNLEISKMNEEAMELIEELQKYHEQNETE